MVEDLEPPSQQTILTQPLPHHHVWQIVAALALFVVAILVGGYVFLNLQNSSDSDNNLSQSSSNSVNANSSQITQNNKSASTTFPHKVSDSELITELLDPNSYKYDLTLTGSVEAQWIPDVNTLVQLDGWFYEDKSYVYSKNPHTRLLDRVTYADRPTFTVFSGNGDEAEWAKDKNYVYNFYTIVKEANPNTFNILSPNNVYAVSGTTLFYSTANQYLGIYQSYKGVDSATLQTLSDEYAKDKNHVFFHAHVLDGVDPKFISFLNRPDCSLTENQYISFCNGYTRINYIKDNNSVFIVREYIDNVFFESTESIPPLVDIVKGADAPTFSFVKGDGFDAQDKNRKYLEGQVVP